MFGKLSILYLDVGKRFELKYALQNTLQPPPPLNHKLNLNPAIK